MKDVKAGVDGRRDSGNGNIVYVVDSLVYGCVGIEVSTELDSNAFAVLDDAVSGEMLGSVEAHVLKEMCKTSLVIIFKDRAHFLGYVEVCLAFRLGIVPYIVGKAVLEMSDTDSRVNRHRWHLLCGCEYTCKQQQGCSKDSLHYFHNISLR